MHRASINVLVTDDHPMFRKGLVDAITDDDGLTVVGEAATGVEALRLLENQDVDVLVTDIDMPKMDGLDLASRALAAREGLKIVILTMHKRERIFNAALDLGVSAYILKDDAVADIVEAVHKAAAGGSYISPSVAEFVMRRGRRNQELKKEVGGLESLTPSELRVLKLIAQNRSSKEIASELGISYRTVGTHRSNIGGKLGLTGKHPLLNFALVNKSVILDLAE